MKRIVMAFIAVAAVATVGVARVTGDSGAAPKPSTSEDRARQDVKDKSSERAKQLKAAQDQVRRGVEEYARRHRPTTAP